MEYKEKKYLTIVNEREMTDETEMLNLIKQLYETLFRKQSVISQAEAGEFLNNLSAPNLLEEQINFCERDIIEKDLFDSLKSIKMINLQEMKEFYETFRKYNRDVNPS